MIAVTGATGHTGRACVEALLGAGGQVRVVVRDRSRADTWATRGVDVAVATLDDPEAVTLALTSVRAAYLMVPPDYAAADLLAAQRRVVNALADAVRRSRLAHAVLLSSIGAQHAAGVGPIGSLHAAEEALRATGRPLTILRAPYFLENWVPVLDAVATRGILPSFLPLDAPFEMAGTADIGAVAAELLQGTPPDGVRVVEMGGHAPVSPRQIADALGHALGRHIEPIATPLDQVVPTFTGLGLPEGTAALFREMYEGVAGGLVAFEDPAAPHVRGLLTAADVLAPMLARA
jgi:uncharacterized protein YbjT (DUF2867 family)